MLVAILAAGQSARFKAAGYNTPKPLLQLKWRERTCTMLTHVLHSVPKHLRKSVRVALPEGNHCGLETPYPITVVPISVTVGQADSCAQLLAGVPDQPVLVLNCDVLFTQQMLGHLVDVSSSHALGLLVQDSNNPAMSYVDTIPYPKVFAEKERISQWAISGAWVCQSSTVLSTACRQTVLACTTEPYLSHALNLIPGTKRACLLAYPFVDWGTPEAVIASGAEVIMEEVG